MAKEVILAGAMDWNFYDANQNLILTAKSLTDSGLNTTVSKDSIRGGKGHKLISNYFYESGLTLSLTSATFSMEYLAMKFGSDITMGADVQTKETLITTVADKITVSKVPVAFPNTTAIVGAYKLSNSTTDTWTKITFTGSDATVSNLPIGSEVCVVYFAEDLSARQIKVPTNIIPDTMYVVGSADEFRATSAGTINTSSSKIGELEVIVPRFQLDPNTDLALTSSGHATTTIGGEALSNEAIGCNSEGFYAILNEKTVGANAFDTCTGIAVIDGDIDLAVAGTETIKVLGVYNNASPTLIDNSLLTFTSSKANATVGSHTGIVTGAIAGDSVITVTVTSKPALATTANVTVTA